MRIALTLGFTLFLAQAALAQGAAGQWRRLARRQRAPAIEPVQPANPTAAVVTPPAPHFGQTPGAEPS